MGFLDIKIEEEKKPVKDTDPKKAKGLFSDEETPEHKAFRKRLTEGPKK